MSTTTDEFVGKLIALYERHLRVIGTFGRVLLWSRDGEPRL
jgi:hypothetical protein